MQKSEDAVILMQQNFKNLVYRIGSSDIVEKMPDIPALQPFSSSVILFLSDLSGRLLKSVKNYPDVSTFAFWIRKSGLLHEKSKYSGIEHRLGKGVVFHSTPSNVPVNFAYSFASGMLAGNANIVRLPSKNFDQVEIICSALETVLKDHEDMLPYIAMVKYESSKEITDYFSSISDVRMIWGGDQTVINLRNSMIPPRSIDITFADRFSILVIGTESLMGLDDIELKKLVHDFYNDTYFSDQNACTSPHLIIWYGQHKNEAKTRFWTELKKLESNYDMTAVQSIGKLSAFYKIGASRNVHFVNTNTNFIYRIHVDRIDSELMEYRYNSGFFFEYDAEMLDEIVSICSKKCQTLLYYGIEKAEILKLVINNGLRGVDRIVPIGRSMDFSLIWDGYDLICELSRKIAF